MRDIVGKIERRPLREVWPYEASRFTPWLVENIDVVGEAIGVELVSAEREQPAGSFSLDILAEDQNGQPVVIENQLGVSDHDHLGKILTYLTAFEAEKAVWIVGEPRPEHVRAVTWLNEASSGSFYLLKVEAIRINDSPPAPLLTLIVGPSEESRQVGTLKRERAERHLLRNEFWTQLLQHAATRTNLHAHISPNDSSSLSVRIGNGLEYGYRVRRHDTQIELNIDRGKGFEAENAKVFNYLEARRQEIESAFGAPLEWIAPDGSGAHSIRKVFEYGGYRNREAWQHVIEETVGAMIRLEEALRPHLRNLT